MLKIAIIDDEIKARSASRKILQEVCPEAEICGEAGTIEEGIELINKMSPNVLLLDIRLKSGTGFDLLNAIEKDNISVIFITAYSEYAIKAIKFSALDYLLKPLDPEELRKAISRLDNKKVSSLETRLTVFEDLMAELKTGLKKIVLSDANGFNVVLIEDIIRCEGEKNYTTFHLLDGQKITTTKSLVEYDRMLSESSFSRVYKSHLINLNHVKAYKKGKGAEAIMVDGSIVPISREKKQLFIQQLKKHL